MPRRNSPPTPTTPPGNSHPNSDTSEGDFVILPRPSLDTSAAGVQQLQSQLSPTAGQVNSSANMVTMMQYDQLVNTARGMKEENNMLRGQLTDMVQTMEARTKEFLQMKSSNRQVAERCKEIRNLANLEVTRLRNQIKTLGEQNQDKTDLQSQNEEFKKAVGTLEGKIQQLETELRNKTEEVLVHVEPGKSDSLSEEALAQTPVSLLTQLKREIKDVQGTRADIQSNMADLEEALQKSAAELKHYKQKADFLALEKQDLVALNNELQTKVMVYSSNGYQDGSLDQSVSTAGSDSDACQQGAAAGSGSNSELPPTPFSPGNAIKKSNLALQDILLQLQAERDKVASLMEDLKKEREDRNRTESTLMEQLDVRSGEHNMALEELNKTHQEQVEELVRKVDDLSVANQEPHHSMELKQQVRSLVCELQDCENILQQKEHFLADLRATNEALKSKISLYHDELEEVRKQDSQMIETLRQELQRQQDHYQLERQRGLMDRINHDKLVDEHQHLRQDYNQLFADFDKLNRVCEEQRARSTQAVNATALRELAEQRDNLTAQLMSAEEAIGVKQDQLDKAKKEHQEATKELQEARTKLEDIPVLEAQAEIYKIDFDAERRAREKAHMERESLMGELEALREESQRMQEELASHAKTQLKQMQHRHSNAGGSGSTSTSSSIGNIYERYISRPLGFGGSHSTGRKNDRGYGGSGEEYGNRDLYEDNYEVIPEMNPGVDVDQLGRGTYDEAGTGQIPAAMAGVVTNMDQGYSQRPNITCPKCQNEFPDIDTLQIHMLDCIK